MPKAKPLRVGALQKTIFNTGRLANVLKTIDFEVFDRRKLENHGFEKQVPGTIPSGSALMARLAYSPGSEWSLPDLNRMPRICVVPSGPEQQIQDQRGAFGQNIKPQLEREYMPH